MDWDDLRFFLAAFRHRTMAGAARELGCEHTTVGRRIAALEGALATSLFTRTPEGLVPTPAAIDLAPLAEKTARAIAEISSVAAQRDTRVAGVVRLTTPEAFAGFVIKRLVELRERCPEVVVEVLSDNRVLDLARGEADLALRFAPTAQNDLVARKLSDVNGAIYASPGYVARRGAAVDSLAGHEVVGYDDSLANVPGARWLARHGDGATVVVRGNSLLSVSSAAAEGLGLAVLPCWLAEPDPRLQRLSATNVTSGSVYLVAHPEVAKIARVRTVMDFLIDVVQRDRALLAG